jgi:hypothetical protein
LLRAYVNDKVLLHRQVFDPYQILNYIIYVDVIYFCVHPPGSQNYRDLPDDTSQEFEQDTSGAERNPDT